MDRNNSYLLPIVIVLAGLGIALAIFFTRSSLTAALPTADLGKLRPVSTADHLVGNPEASVVVVEYSDIDCEYCKQFQQAMEQVMADHAGKGDLAWVYRHFPLIEVHPNAPAHAEAAECVASLGGSDLFFRFIDAVNQAAPGSSQFDPKNYGSIITSLGLSPSDFQTCIDGTEFQKRVADDFDNAMAIGAVGAPYSVILVKGHDPIPVAGALPYTALVKVLDTALQEAAAPAKN